MTQTDMILRFMLDGNTITPLEALDHFGCFRLASRICDIERKGYRVERKIISKKNMYGKTIRHAKYWIDRVGEQRTFNF